MIQIKRALLSVSDKSGVADLAQTLHRFGCELISTGGTAAMLRNAGLPVTDISQVSGNPEAFGGRMKTISFNVESALLFDRERDHDQAEALGITPIDMVVCNLYPFETQAATGASDQTLIEHIDVGGPTMIRAAAKNSRWVTVVTRPEEYDAIRDELERNDGSISAQTRSRLMRAAFHHTADYDAAIATALSERAGERTLRLAFDPGQELRYGENWHQRAWLHRRRGCEDSLADLEVIQGGQLSFNNIVDLEAALSTVRSLVGQGCAVIKHTNPCGLSLASDQRRALELAWAGDPVSAFGSVVAFTHPVEAETIAFLELDHPETSHRKFVDVMVAPDYSPKTLESLAPQKRLKVIRFNPARLKGDLDIRILGSACLAQSRDDELLAKLEVATECVPAKKDRELIEFGLIAVAQVKSNAIVVVRRLSDRTLQLLGMGAGQPNRVQSTRLALERSRENLAAEHQGPLETRQNYIRDELGRAVLVSDAFFPFPDSIECCAEAGVRIVVQPGGSIRDGQVIARCDELQVAMIFTGTRHFKH
jgi:phosphoribosylaminoimidazolecarboxamide formyltransferase/IMP cyclohydrolase